MSDFIHKIRITGMTKKATYNGASDVISHVRWKLETYHKDYPDEVVTFDGATPLKITAASLQEENFKSLQDVKESDVIDWVYSNAGNLGALKYANEKKVKETLFIETSVVSTLPWEVE